MGSHRFDRWVVGAVFVGVALRLVNLGSAPLWFDETYTFLHMVAPWQGYLQSVVGDNQAPIYYVATKLWTGLAGLSPWSMRIPGLLASAACIPLVAAAARIVRGERAARVAAWLAAISPFLIQHGQDARPYALLAAFAVADLLLLLRFVEGRSSHLGFWWVTLAFAVVATHFFGIFFLAGQGLALLILRPQPLRSWFPAAVAAGLLCGGAVVAAALKASGTFAGQYVLGLTAMPGVVWSMVTGYTLMPTSEEMHALGPRAILPHLPVALVALPAFALVALAGVRRVHPRARVVLLSSFLVALLAPFAYRLVAGAGVHPRYFAAAIAPILILVAVGMAPTELRSPRGIATAILAVIMVAGTFLHLRDTGHGREDIRAAGEWLDAHVPPDEEILITSAEMLHLAQFHFPQRKFRLYPPERTVVPPDRVDGVADALPFPGDDRAIYIVGRAWLTDPSGNLQTALHERYPSCPGVDVPGIRILCLRRHSDAAIAHALQ